MRATRSRIRRRATSLATRSAATITRCCASGCSGSPTAIAERIGEFGYRVFVDSAPVLEKALARDAGLGWIGKHTNLLDRDGSWFLLGELYTDLPLPADAPVTEHCGSCTRMHRRLPDAGDRRAVRARCSPLHLVPDDRAARLDPGSRCARPIGNRIFGCDDCQLFCPWNKFARATTVGDFAVRHGLDGGGLVELFAWSRDGVGSAHRGIGVAPRRLRRLATQHRGSARQRAGRRAHRRGPRRPRRRSVRRSSASTSVGLDGRAATRARHAGGARQRAWRGEPLAPARRLGRLRAEPPEPRAGGARAERATPATAAKLYADGRRRAADLRRWMPPAKTARFGTYSPGSIGGARCGFKQPSRLELAHDFLWRTTLHLPQRGRSRYSTAAIRGGARGARASRAARAAARARTASAELWAHRYHSIIEHERLSRGRGGHLEFWLNISQDEQRQRLLADRRAGKAVEVPRRRPRGACPVGRLSDRVRECLRAT